MGGNKPNDQPGKPHHLKERQAHPAPALGLMNPPVSQMKRIIISLAVPVTQGLHVCPT